mmetsp:Transcript_38624/g.97043  ORF Transcript_38624/g.97043 Transcript_38624/m.97043 type:complete len:437 (+) Transcript_38624:16-1326(+)
MAPRKVCCSLSLLFSSAAGLCQMPDDGKHFNRHCVIENLKYNTDSKWKQLQAEAMPPEVNTILLQEEFESWDLDRAPMMQGFLKELLGFQYFAHARDTFANHLRGTWGILNAWGQPMDICRAGLFHTIYGGDLFIFSTLDPFEEEASRPRLRDVVEEEAEALTWDFGTLARGLVNASLHASRWATLEDHMSLHSFVGAEKNLTAKQIAKIMVVTMADYLDQLVEINLWRDFHSHEPPSFLYPGTMKPEVALFWISRVCKGIKDHLDVVPPIFDHCTSEISYEAEREARDLYWQVISDTHSMGLSLQVDLLQGAVRRNPFIAEPHVYLAELHFQRGDFDDCVDETRTALRLFYNMGTHWDKRVPFRQWISHTRLLLVRCVRRMEGKPSMPLTRDGVVLTNELVTEMDRVSPIRSYPNVSLPRDHHVVAPLILRSPHA